MNLIIENLLSRKSVRVFENKPIDNDIKQAILLSAVNAPSAGNQQLYTILDITDQKIKDRLAVTCDNQPFIARAPMVLIFCADTQKWYDVFTDSKCHPAPPAQSDLLLTIDDAVIAAQNAVTAAWSVGVGSCYIGDIMERCEEHRQLLNLTPYVFPAAMVVFGYPTKQQLERPKPPRSDLKYIVHENTYHRLESAQLHQMLADQPVNQTYEQWCQAFFARKYNADFSKEMARSVDVYLSDFKTK